MTTAKDAMRKRMTASPKFSGRKSDHAGIYAAFKRGESPLTIAMRHKLRIDELYDIVKKQDDEGAVECST